MSALLFGLPDHSRVKRKLSGVSLSLTEILLARIVDYTALLYWSKTEDARKGRNAPESVLDRLLHPDSYQSDTESFESGAEFDRAWAELARKGE